MEKGLRNQEKSLSLFLGRKNPEKMAILAEFQPWCALERCKNDNPGRKNSIHLLRGVTIHAKWACERGVWGLWDPYGSEK